MRILGHDPGCTGGLVLTVDGEARAWKAIRRHVKGVKRRERRVDAREIYDWICDAAPDVMISEGVWGRGSDTPMTAWSFSGAESAVVAAAQIADVPVVFALPQEWQKAIFLRLPHETPEERKSSAFAFARERHPAMASVLKLKSNDGLADAACIAEYGWRLHKHGRL